jgi:hypothetical protein
MPYAGRIRGIASEKSHLEGTSSRPQFQRQLPRQSPQALWKSKGDAVSLIRIGEGRELRTYMKIKGHEILDIWFDRL